MLRIDFLFVGICSLKIQYEQVNLFSTTTTIQTRTLSVVKGKRGANGKKKFLSREVFSL